jgi:hypothetical protein
MVPKTPDRRTPLAVAALAVAAFLCLAAPAFALPVDVFFDGETMLGDPDTNFGIREASAFDARDSFGIQILDSFDYVGAITGILTTNQSLQSYSPNPPTSSLNRATSNWSMNNVFGSDIVGGSYVLFTHTDPFTVNGVTIDYARRRDHAEFETNPIDRTALRRVRGRAPGRRRRPRSRLFGARRSDRAGGDTRRQRDLWRRDDLDRLGVERGLPGGRCAHATRARQSGHDRHDGERHP